MEIEIEKEKNKATAPITGFYNVNLKVSDGIRFGFGFGLSMIFWGLLLTTISLVCAYFLMKQATQSFNEQMLKATKESSVQRMIK